LIPGGETLQVLEELGLSCSAAKVYVALLKLGPESRATSISKFAKVPRQDIYRVLEELSQVGVVEKTISRPARFRAVSAKKAIALLLKRKKEAFLKLEQDADSLSGRLSENLNVASSDPKKDRFFLINERESIITKGVEGIWIARRKVWLIMPWSEVMFTIDVAFEAINKACNRGVDVRWITDEPKEAQQLPEGLRMLAENPNFKFRLSAQPPTVKLGICDDTVGIAIFPDNTSALSPALCSNNLALLAMAERYYETYWSSGKDIHR
jgi:sugar-specific transcriptional regulator TrmB